MIDVDARILVVWSRLWWWWRQRPCIGTRHGHESFDGFRVHASMVRTARLACASSPSILLGSKVCFELRKLQTWVDAECKLLPWVASGLLEEVLPSGCGLSGLVSAGGSSKGTRIEGMIPISLLPLLELVSASRTARPTIRSPMPVLDGSSLCFAGRTEPSPFDI
jgi:hypothetical protein